MTELRQSVLTTEGSLKEGITGQTDQAIMFCHKPNFDSPRCLDYQFVEVSGLVSTLVALGKTSACSTPSLRNLRTVALKTVDALVCLNTVYCPHLHFPGDQFSDALVCPRSEIHQASQYFCLSKLKTTCDIRSAAS